MSALPDLRTREAIQGYLRGISMEMGVSLSDPRLAAELDKRDKLAEFRDKFHIPIISDYMEGEEIAEGRCLSVCLAGMTQLIRSCQQHNLSFLKETQRFWEGERKIPGA